MGGFYIYELPNLALDSEETKTLSQRTGSLNPKSLSWVLAKGFYLSCHTKETKVCTIDPYYGSFPDWSKMLKFGFRAWGLLRGVGLPGNLARVLSSHESLHKGSGFRA